ncbi:Endonuclease/exonuclease/phosphatase family domain-containing protein 1 [Tupaia chinensis]|uniref:Endonuclease/exonuclease/phosphatase family domain-containing protein 1 n=1 Tax=Tupaia chinensis TaxID=246437 RepID=L9L5I3_TUPCH|nr:Endonuclease/exonuclease/phosphatase family domain-containing protein 1 [Tupaia chinensis]
MTRMAWPANPGPCRGRQRAPCERCHQGQVTCGTGDKAVCGGGWGTRRPADVRGGFRKVMESGIRGAGYSGFLWDAAGGVELRDAAWQESSPSNGHGKPTGPSPYLARFKVGSNDLILVNLHLAALALPGGENPSKNHSDGHRLAQTLQETLKGEKDVIVLGHFGQGPESSDYDILRKEKFQPLVPAHTFTNISTKNPQGAKSLDNIWISKGLKKAFTGHWAVVREGLTNPWIPDNWSWGGVASEHCPVLAEFYAEKDWGKKEGPRNGSGVTLERSEAKHER